MAEITDKIKLPVRVEQHREAIGETGDYDYFWLLLDSDGTQVAWWLDGDKEKGIAEQIRDSLNATTPASTEQKTEIGVDADAKAVWAKLALGEFKTTNGDGEYTIVITEKKLASALSAAKGRAMGDNLEKLKNDAFRFASEIGVDAETEALLLAVAEWHQAWEKEGARPDIYRLAVEKLADYYKRFVNKQINAALKAAGGGK